MATLVVFDLDGTLVDSRQDLAESANALLATYDAAPLDVDAVASMVGDGARSLVERTLAAASVEAEVPAALARFLAIYGTRLLIHTRPYDGMLDALACLSQRATLAVLTNKPEGLSRQLVEALGMSPYLSRVVGGDSGFPRKPDPAGLRHLMAEAAAIPAHTVYVGDSMIDVETARTASVAVVVAGYGFGHLRQPLALRPEELLARTPADIPTLVARALESRKPDLTGRTS